MRWEILSTRHMPPPTVEMLQASAAEFQQLWNFPNCVGAMDGKHVIIQAPDISIIKKIFSKVLLALFHARYKFLAVDIGAYGRNSDSGIFGASRIGRLLEKGQSIMPAKASHPGRNDPMPHAIFTDEGFQFKEYILRPYPQTRQDECAEVFNYRLSRARRMIEISSGY